MSVLKEPGRQIVAVPVSREDVIELFQERSRPTIAVKRFSLPEGYIIRGVNYAPYEDCFVFIVEHPSFDPVPLGQILPKLGANIEDTLKIYRLMQKTESFATVE